MPSLPAHIKQIIPLIPVGRFTVRHPNFEGIDRPANILLSMKVRGLVRRVGRATDRADGHGIGLWVATDRLDRLRRRC